MRGKRGPKPETPAEIAERENEPTAEEIVGAENVVDVSEETNYCAESGCINPVGNVETHCSEHGGFRQPDGYKCSLPGCAFTSNLLSEMEEHVNGTGHGKFDTAPVQPELFSQPGVIHREVKIPLDETLLNEKKTRLAKLYQSALDVKEEKKEADSDFNARLKNIDESMQEIARVLAKPWTYENVKAEWHIIDGNARELRRIDTGEVLETKPLAMEDKIAEEQKAAIDNADEGPDDETCEHGVNVNDECTVCHDSEVETEELVN